ncbi:choice-of-anchor A family protein [Dyadobacter sp. CY261]|uniref:choice-of-anchor A family protein n=1 Tax=Dyadobacter sp. CY261 TaxID=2907203 RepID=UPI001F2E0839|nr:choice-of-anchor A family protein [Dyadobacter sp. CY261]MCF0073825.1 choice-of-anchor A family protein [Dyadobacter sp. CY261]
MYAKPLFVSFLALLLVNAKQVFAQSPTSAATRFNIFVKGDAVLQSSETEGPIAVGGNVTTNQYQISFNKEHGVLFVNNASIGLAVRGGVKLNSGSLTVNGDNYVKIGNCTPSDASATKLRVWYKDNNNAASTIRITEINKQYWETPNITINANINTWSPSVSENVNPVCESVFGTGPGQIDMDAAFISFIKRSNQLKEMADNLPIRDQNGNIMQSAAMGPYLDPNIFGNNPKIIVDPNKINVLTVSAAVWNKIGSSNIEGIPQGLQIGNTSYTGPFGLIVNIVDFPTFANSNGNDRINFPTFGGLSDSQASYVIYNFPDATKSITLGGNGQISGTIFAPQADVVKENNGNINGQIIAKSFVHKSDEVHFWPFLPSIVPPVEKKIDIVVSTKCEKNAPYLDYTVTPNYDATGETVKIEWVAAGSKIVQEDSGLPLTGSILFPGASVDVDGNGIAWPGFKLEDKKWVEVPDDRYGALREDGASIRVTLIPPYVEVNITYPTSTTTCYTTPPPATPLPVTLAYFTAQNVNCNAELKWQVTEAKDFSHFEVERSSDAKTYDVIAKIDYAAAKSTYSFNDTPFSTESVPVKAYYYRLKQVDIDETFEYSAIRGVQAGTCDSRLAVDFFPNPTQDEMNVRSYSPVKKLEIFTLGGKQVYQVMPAASETEIKVNIQAFAQGMYIVNVVNAEGKYSSKVFKK